MKRSKLVGLMAVIVMSILISIPATVLAQTDQDNITAPGGPATSAEELNQA